MVPNCIILFRKTGVHSFSWAKFNHVNTPHSFNVVFHWWTSELILSFNCGQLSFVNMNVWKTVVCWLHFIWVNSEGGTTVLLANLMIITFKPCFYASVGCQLLPWLSWSWDLFQLGFRSCVPTCCCVVALSMLLGMPSLSSGRFPPANVSFTVPGYLLPLPSVFCPCSESADISPIHPSSTSGVCA